MDALGIDRAVLMALANPEAEYTLITTEEVVAICAEHSDRLIPFIGIDPRGFRNSPKADFRPLLSVWKDAGCRGIGEYTPNLPFDDPRNMNLFAQAEELGLPLTFHVATRTRNAYGCYDDLGLPRLERVLKEFPSLIFLGHSPAFWSEIAADVPEETRNGYPKGRVTPGRVVTLMREYPNLHGDLSAGSGCNAVSRDPEFGRAFLEEFQDRLHFGTDIAGASQEPPLVAHLRGLLADGTIAQEVFDKIARRNTKRVLGISARGAEDTG